MITRRREMPIARIYRFLIFPKKRSINIQIDCSFGRIRANAHKKKAPEPVGRFQG